MTAYGTIFEQEALAQKETEVFEPWIRRWARIKIRELSEQAQSQVVIKVESR